METMRAAVSGGRAVFYFKTKNRLFHQFALERTNTTGIFVRRVEALKAQAEETAAAVRGAADAVKTGAQPDSDERRGSADGSSGDGGCEKVGG